VAAGVIVLIRRQNKKKKSVRKENKDNP